MSAFSQKDIQLLFVGGNAAATTGAISAMNDGEIGIFTPAGVRVTEATAATVDKFMIVKKTPNGGVPLVSPVVNKKDIKRIYRKVYVPSAEQVSTIGYDGTNGAIESINDNEYHVRVSLRQGYISNHGGLYLKHGFYKSDISATQYEVASGLLLDLVTNFSKEAEKVIMFEMLLNAAGVATAGTTAVVKGSKTIIASVPADYQVGGAVRLGTTTSAATYKVVSIVGNVVTLETRVTAATQTFAIGAARGITAANAAAATCGVRATGIASIHVTGKLHGDLMPNIFDISLENFGSTPNVLVTNASAGNGTEKQLKELEWFCQGNE
jgi:hypothetical protein